MRYHTAAHSCCGDQTNYWPLYCYATEAFLLVALRGGDSNAAAAGEMIMMMTIVMMVIIVVAMVVMMMTMVIMVVVMAVPSPNQFTVRATNCRLAQHDINSEYV